MSRAYVTRIFDILESQGRTRTWFARQMGMNRTQLYQINWGERPLTDAFMDRAAQVLQVPHDMLFSLPSELRPRNETLRDERVA